MISKIESKENIGSKIEIQEMRNSEFKNMLL